MLKFDELFDYTTETFSQTGEFMTDIWMQKNSRQLQSSRCIFLYSSVAIQEPAKGCLNK